MSNDLPTWKTIDSKYLINDRWIKLRADTCVTPESKTITPWYVLEYPEWASCLAIDSDDQVLLLRHYRQGAGAYIQEIVSGAMEPHETEPKKTMARELTEEIGYTGGEIFMTGVTYANPAIQNNRVHSFLAVGGACTAQTKDELGANFVLEKIPFKKFVALITDPNDKAVRQGLNLASIFFAFNFIRRPGVDSPTIKHLRSMLD
jgi:8-oxo-dGTP pyrophosphatase MutT (NUDIX family)